MATANEGAVEWRRLVVCATESLTKIVGTWDSKIREPETENAVRF